MNISYTQLKNSMPELLEQLIGKRINKFICFCNDVFCFSLTKNSLGIFSLKNSNPFVGYANTDAHFVSLSNPDIQLLKKELSNFQIIDIKLKDDDRVLTMTLNGTNEVFKEEIKYLVFELIPRKANLFLLNSENKIIFSLKESSDGRLTKRNALYSYPSCSPFNIEENNEKINFIELFDEICEQRKNEKFHDIFSFLKKRIKINSSKTEKIQNDVDKAKEHLNDADLGNLILMHLSEIKYKDKELLVDDISISLDPRLKGYENANAYFKRAKKAKATIEQSTANLQRAINELNSLQSIYESLENSDEETCDKLIDEFNLSSLLIKASETVNTPISRANHPYFCTYNNVSIVFGKTAIQNDYLTFIHDTSKKHLWMHIIGMPGAHLMIKSENPSQEVISLCAEIVCYASKQVDCLVMLTNRENVFKGSVNGEVSVKKYTTLRINKISEEAIALYNSAIKI